MKDIYILTTNDNTFNSLNRYLKYVHSVNLVQVISSEFLSKETNDVCHKYNYVFDKVQKILSINKNPLIFIDTYCQDFSSDLDSPNVLQSENLSAMLYLTFPKIYWVYLASDSQKYKIEFPFFNADAFKRLHILDCTKTSELKNKFELIYESYMSRYEPLFDPTGYRNLLKYLAVSNNSEAEVSETRLPFIRKAEGISIDDEINYSYYYSYFAYSNGIRVWNINSYKFLGWISEKESKEGADSKWNIPVKNLKYSFEDLFISYFDKKMDPDGRHPSMLKVRDTMFKFLGGIKNRIILTVGHSNKKFKEIGKANKIYKKKKKKSGQKFQQIFKPIPSLYGLGNFVKIEDKFYSESADDTKVDSDYHSSPGRIKEIADRMIERAEALLETRECLTDLITGAVIARDAQELLANRTPTISLRALDVRHELEVTFECLFEGVDYSLHAKERIKALKKEVSTICEWFQKGKIRKRANISSLSAIIGKLVIRFRENNQFDEEDYSISELRKLQGLALLLKYPFLKMFYPFRWYLEMLLKSIPFFVGAVLIWVLLFAIIWQQADIVSGESDFSKYLIYSLQSIVGSSIPNAALDGKLTIYRLSILSFPIIIGFVHLGIFISHLYNKFLRR
jgi:hypothetical protein